MAADPCVVWLVEDNRAFRSAVRRVLESIPAVTGVAEFGSGEAMLDAFARGPRPQVMLVDVGLPGLSGLDCTRRVREAAPEVRIVVLTVFDDEEKIGGALRAGATGYLLKSSSREDIASALQAVREGGAPMSPHAARRVLDMFARQSVKQGATPRALAPREREVLGFLVRGQTNKEIAHALGLSVHTVDGYLRTLYEKLEVRSRAAAVAKAVRDRIV